MIEIKLADRGLKEPSIGSVGKGHYLLSLEEDVQDRIANRHTMKSIKMSVEKILLSLESNKTKNLSKPLLTIDEAAELISVGKKRFNNIICEEKKRTGKTPDFVADNGCLGRRILRDKLIEWVSKCKNTKKCRRRST